MKTKSNNSNLRTMVVLYDRDLKAIEKLRERFRGLPASRYHSEVMRRAIEQVASSPPRRFDSEFIESCERADGTPTKHAVVLRELSQVLDSVMRKYKIKSVSSALRVILRHVAGV